MPINLERSAALLGFIKAQIFVTLMLFCMGQLGRMTFYSGQATIYLYEISLISLLTLLLYVYRSKPMIYFFSKFRGIALFLSVLVITFLFSVPRYSSPENLVALMYLVRLFVYFLFFSYFLYFLKSEKNFLESMRLLLLFLIFFSVVSALLQYFLYPDLRNLYHQGWDPHLYRVFGTFFEPVIAASVYGLFIIFAFTHKEFFFKEYLRYISAVFLGILFFLTYTRSAIIAMLATIFIFLFKKRPWYAVLTIVIFVSMLFVLPKKAGEGVNLWRTSTILSRLADVEEGIHLASENIFAGIGYNHIRFEKQVSDPGNHASSGFHSSFLIILVAAGIFGLISFLYMLYEFGSISLAAGLYTLYLGIISLFDNVFLHPFLLLIYFVFLSIEQVNRPSSSEQ